MVHGSKKRWKHVHLCKISEKIHVYYQLVVAPPVVTIHNPFMLVWFSLRNVYVILLMVTRTKLVRSEIN